MSDRDPGNTGEEIVARACDYLVETWDEVAWHLTSRLLDSGGVDRLIILKSGLAFALQVKTSRRGVKSHREHHDRPWYRHIPVILVLPEEIDHPRERSTIQGVAARIKLMVVEAYRKVKVSPLPA